MSNVLLFPGCASSPSDIAAREQETGLVAVRQRGSRLVIRMVPELQDVATDQQTNGGTLSLEIDRDQAARFGLDPHRTIIIPAIAWKVLRAWAGGQLALKTNAAIA